jgi:phage terminase large subunit-like protein
VTGKLPRLRPEPWPVTPYGPFRLQPDGKLERFPSEGVRVIRWIEEHCVLTRDRWRGKPMRLLPWQKQLLVDLFELVPDDGLGRMRRRYRSALIGVPKKQGKTELVAALGVYFLLGSGEPDPNIACAAAAETQADLVFGAARSIVELSPTLRGLATCYARSIQVRGRPAEQMRRVPANGGKFDGQNLLAGVADEIHEWITPNQRKMHGMLSGAFATREEPMHLMITTAGEDEGDEDDEFVAPWLRMYRYGRRVESGEVEDPSFFFRWWMAPDGVDHRDSEVWASPAVNPSFGVTVRREFYEAELGKRTEAEFRRYYLNQPQEALNTWVEPQLWDACAVPGGVELDPKAPTWIGWDASTKRDSTAVVAVQWGTVDGRRRLLAKHWLWERPPGPDGRPAENWTVPRREVVATIEELHETLNVQATAYDPWAITWVVDDLEDRGLPLVEYPQRDERMVPATVALLELVLDAELAHDGAPALRRHVLSAKAKTVPRSGIRLVKGERGKKIDLAIALAIAVGAMRAQEQAPPAPRGPGLYLLDDE